jgi:hypothetical protein
MKRILYIVLALMAALLRGYGVTAVPPPLQVTPESGMILASDYLLFAQDAEQQQDENEAADLDAQGWFVAPPCPGGEPAFGYIGQALWARLAVHNPTDSDLTVMLELSIARLGSLSWYVVENGKILQRVEQGLEMAGRGGLPTRYPLIAFSLPVGAERMVYVRVVSDSSIWFPLRVGDALAYAQYVGKRDLLDYGFIGTGVVLLLLPLLYGLLQRSRLYLLLALIVAGFMGYYLIFHGYYQWAGGPWQDWVNRQGMLAVALLAHWAFFEFSMTFLRQVVSSRSPMLMRTISWALLACSVIICVVPFGVTVPLLVALLGVCYVSGSVYSLRVAYRSSSRYAQLLAGVWMLTLLVNLGMVAQFLGWVPYCASPIVLQRLSLLFSFAVFFALVSGQHRQAQHEKQRAQRAEHLATEAQLRALRHQLNPHFLFNTLASIDALSEEMPQRIPELVRKLATYLRLRIDPSTDGMTMLGKEVESIRAYLDIEKVRFEEALVTDYSIEEEALSHRIPEMLLQPLVENVIKHGAPPDGVLRIRVSARRKGAELVLRVENNGRMRGRRRDDGRAGGVGTANLIERLAHLYGDGARFELRQEGALVVAEIRLPWDGEVFS